MHNLDLPTPTWALESHDWLDVDVVELCFTADDGGEALVTVRVDVELPGSPSEPAYVDLVVLDVEGAALDAAREVGRHKRLLEDEFWTQWSRGWRC